MSRKNFNNATLGALYQEKKTRRGRPYSPYCHGHLSINNNQCEIEQSQLIAQIVEDAKMLRQNNNLNKIHHNLHHNNQENTTKIHNNSRKKVPFHHLQQQQQQITAYRDVPSHDSETEDNIIMDQCEPISDEKNHTHANPESEDDENENNEEEASSVPTKSTSKERSDSVIITGSYTQHDIDLEEISRIRTNGECFESFCYKKEKMEVVVCKKR